MTKWMTRKDIALEFEVTYDQVRKNEKSWGLADRNVKQVLNRSTVRYLRTGVLAAFARRGFIPKKTSGRL